MKPKTAFEKEMVAEAQDVGFNSEAIHDLLKEFRKGEKNVIRQNLQSGARNRRSN